MRLPALVSVRLPALGVGARATLNASGRTGGILRCGRFVIPVDQPD
jgi:hypothetical protein